MSAQLPGLPTQVVHSTRAAWRTFIQSLPVLTAVALFLPEVLEIVADNVYLDAGVRAWLLGAAAVISALIATVTKIMNLPGVNAFIETHLKSLATGVHTEEVDATPVPEDYTPRHRA